MPFDATEIKEQIILEVGDINPVTGDTPVSAADGLLYGRIDWLWERFAAKDRVGSGLRELYVKRAALRMILAVLANKRFDVTDVLAGFGMKANQIWDHYTQMYACSKAEIQAYELKFGTSATPRAGRLATRAPVRPGYRPDGNAPRYGGDLYNQRWPGSVSR